MILSLRYVIVLFGKSGMYFTCDCYNGKEIIYPKICYNGIDLGLTCVILETMICGKIGSEFRPHSQLI